MYVSGIGKNADCWVHGTLSGELDPTAAALALHALPILSFLTVPEWVSGVGETNLVIVTYTRQQATHGIDTMTNIPYKDTSGGPCSARAQLD